MTTMDRALKELEDMEGSAACIAETLGLSTKAASSALTNLVDAGLARIAGSEDFFDRNNIRHKRHIYQITQKGYAKLMGTLAA